MKTLQTIRDLLLIVTCVIVIDGYRMMLNYFDITYHHYEMTQLHQEMTEIYQESQFEQQIRKTDR